MEHEMDNGGMGKIKAQQEYDKIVKWVMKNGESAIEPGHTTHANTHSQHDTQVPVCSNILYKSNGGGRAQNIF